MHEIYLERLDYAARSLIRGETFERCGVEPELYVSKELDNLALTLRSYVWCEDIGSKTRKLRVLKNKKLYVDFNITYPSSWWQMLKRDYFPRWFIKRFPVKYVDEKRVQKKYITAHFPLEITSDIVATYPQFIHFQPKHTPVVKFRGLDVDYKRPLYIKDMPCEIDGINNLSGYSECKYRITTDGKLIEGDE